MWFSCCEVGGGAVEFGDVELIVGNHLCCFREGR